MNVLNMFFSKNMDIDVNIGIFPACVDVELLSATERVTKVYHLLLSVHKGSRPRDLHIVTRKGPPKTFTVISRL